MLAIIPARGGSKGLPGKNTRLLGGKPLIAWTISAAKNARCVTRTIVSTDSPEIARIAEEYGAEVPFLRPAELASDSASSVEVVHHAQSKLNENYDLIVLLQPTSPFRTSEHIQLAYDLSLSENPSSVVSVCCATKSPFWHFWRSDDGTLSPVLESHAGMVRRQELASAYCLNGAIYLLRSSLFKASKKFVFEDTQSILMNESESVDIDSLLDFQMAQLILGEK